MAGKDLLSVIQDVLIEWADDWSDKMRASLLKHDHVDSAGAGNLYQMASAGGESWISAEGNAAFRIKIDLPDYYQYLNKGRGPTRGGGARGMGSLRASLSGPTGWIARKGINVRQVTGIKDSIKANKALAFIISRSIHKKGFEASHWFDEVWGGDPVPDNSPALQDLRTRLIKKIGNSDFLLTLIQ